MCGYFLAPTPYIFPAPGSEDPKPLQMEACAPQIVITFPLIDCPLRTAVRSGFHVDPFAIRSSAAPLKTLNRFWTTACRIIASTTTGWRGLSGGLNSWKISGKGGENRYEKGSDWLPKNRRLSWKMNRSRFDKRRFKASEHLAHSLPKGLATHTHTLKSTHPHTSTHTHTHTHTGLRSTFTR